MGESELADSEIDWAISLHVFGVTDALDQPRYSTDVTAAWSVVEEMRKRSDGHFTLMGFTTNWRASWGTPNEREDIEDMVAAETAARAICLAALRELSVW